MSPQSRLSPGNHLMALAPGIVGLCSHPASRQHRASEGVLGFRVCDRRPSADGRPPISASVFAALLSPRRGVRERMLYRL